MWMSVNKTPAAVLYSIKISRFFIILIKIGFIKYHKVLFYTLLCNENRKITWFNVFENSTLIVLDCITMLNEKRFFRHTKEHKHSHATCITRTMIDSDCCWVHPFALIYFWTMGNATGTSQLPKKCKQFNQQYNSYIFSKSKEPFRIGFGDIGIM